MYVCVCVFVCVFVCVNDSRNLAALMTYDRSHRSQRIEYRKTRHILLYIHGIIVTQTLINQQSYVARSKYECGLVVDADKADKPLVSIYVHIYISLQLLQQLYRILLFILWEINYRSFLLNTAHTVRTYYVSCARKRRL